MTGQIEAPDTGGTTASARRPSTNRWRIGAWSAAAVLLLIPLVAMQFTDSVQWSPADFAVAALLLLGLGLPIEIVVRTSRNGAYRAGVVLAVAAAFLMLWSNGAVGIIGPESSAVNLFYYLLLLAGVMATFAVRFRAAAMATIAASLALVQAVFAAVAALAGWGLPESGALEILAVNGFFIALWAGSAVLFHQVASGTSSAVG